MVGQFNQNCCRNAAPPGSMQWITRVNLCKRDLRSHQRRQTNERESRFLRYIVLLFHPGLRTWNSFVFQEANREELVHLRTRKEIFGRAEAWYYYLDFDQADLLIFWRLGLHVSACPRQHHWSSASTLLSWLCYLGEDDTIVRFPPRPAKGHSVHI